MARIPKNLHWKPTGRTISQGGQGTVVEVEPIEGSRFSRDFYAMKVLRNTGSKQAVQRFEREIKAVMNAEIEGLVDVVDSHEQGSKFLYYVMPQYEQRGFKPLDDVVFSTDSPFRRDARRCLLFIAKCADVLHELHSLDPPITHRDIKPANILCHRKTLEPLLIDFGCCQIHGDEVLTLVDEGVGTKDYMAPECETGAGGDAGPRADIYSLGKLLWTLVTGKRAFSREQPAFTRCNMTQEFPNDRDCWHLTGVFEKSIRREPSHRFRDAKIMAGACRFIANDLVGRFPPLEAVGQRCPACGQADLVDPNNRSGGRYPIQIWQVFGNPMPSGAVGFRCPTCGFLAAWDIRLLRDREKGLAEME